MEESLPRLERLRIGGGLIEPGEGGVVRLALPMLGRQYADAQLDDTSGLSRAHFRHHPPFHLHLRARASHPRPVGTLGFGLWNDPFAFSLGLAGAARHLPAPPQALWFFFGSPPNDMAYAEPGVPSGWKAASLCSPHLPGALVAAGGLGLMGLGVVRRLQASAVRWALATVLASEARIDVDLADWHSYDLMWADTGAEFVVDGELVLRVDRPPDPPLGFVAWIDNQFAIISRDEGVRFGILPVPEPEWLELSDLRLEDSSSL